MYVTPECAGSTHFVHAIPHGSSERKETVAVSAKEQSASESVILSVQGHLLRWNFDFFSSFFFHFHTQMCKFILILLLMFPIKLPLFLINSISSAERQSLSIIYSVHTQKTNSFDDSWVNEWKKKFFAVIDFSWMKTFHFIDNLHKITCINSMVASWHMNLEV
jgi:hypothetical protein